ncbi:hypothetical protein BS50DRAFT_625508 [Corynespora cassiicola Philippines]|uniref:Rhodopsin domain-containing protein n=1 Tax=Corynespora cassiicola Philippines TaxID=1448308 RepID=A0A2T2N762_CORCC|nr:hypothetical protein BS50DRAFT_625508 [Corynespora cassiicola Philippines]
MSSNIIASSHKSFSDDYMTADTGTILIAVGSVPFGLDDIFLLLALFSNLILCGLSIAAVPYAGAGRHILAILIEDPGKIKFLFINALMIMPIAYMFAVAFSKLAIIGIFLRIFRIGATRKVAYGMAVVLMIHLVVATFLTIFQCTPVSAFWTEVDRKSCIDIQQFFAYISLANFAEDLIMTAMPLPEIWKLHKTVETKIGLTVTLLTASIGIVSSFLKFNGFYKANIFDDPSWKCTPLMSYALAEPGTYFIAACLPSFRPIIRYINTNWVSLMLKKIGLRRELELSSVPAENENAMREIKKRNDDIERGVAVKPVQGFATILLSEISASKTTTRFIS